MKLVIQIPCHNEEDNIGKVLEDLKENFTLKCDKKIVVLNDGSSDKTYKVASKYNVEILTSNDKKGLSYTFKKGVEYALSNDADILVNIDGDYQYKAENIEKLIQPIINDKADIVIGSRPINKIKSFSIFKKVMQKIGSYIVKLVSNINIKDAPSGFRAFNRYAMLHINIFNSFSYTIESIIQAKAKGLRIENIDVDVNEQTKRKSRLFNNSFDYVFKQAKNLIRFFIIYRPCRFFGLFGFMFLFFGFLLGIRFIYYSTGHIQSLILCAILLSLSFVCFALAILGDIIAINRKLLEEIRFELRNEKYKK